MNLKKIIFSFLCVFLNACGSTDGANSMHYKPHTWTHAEQQQMLADEKKLPADSIIIPVLEDCSRARKELK